MRQGINFIVFPMTVKLTPVPSIEKRASFSYYFAVSPS